MITIISYAANKICYVAVCKMFKMHQELNVSNFNLNEFKLILKINS